MKLKTNRQWLAEHPEHISHRIVLNAIEWAIKKYGRAETYKMSSAEVVDAWLNAPRKEPEGNTVVFTVEVTRTFRGEPPLPSTLEREAARIAENIRKAGTDGASVSKIQVLVREK